MKKYLLTISFVVSVLLSSVSCINGGNSYESTMYYPLVCTMADSVGLYVNANDTIENLNPGVTYNSPLSICSAYKINHYVNNKQFVGGITLTNMSDTKLESADNYSSVVGHSVVGLTSENSQYNKTCFIGDLTKDCKILFISSDANQFPLEMSPQNIYVTNAAYTYLAVSKGVDNYTAFENNESLILCITALDKSGLSKGKMITVELSRGSSAIFQWQEVDLLSLGTCYGLQFTLQDANGKDMSSERCPLRFCFDYLNCKYEIKL